jgi:D-alanyl-D-alanine dipeptidase
MKTLTAVLLLLCATAFAQQPLSDSSQALVVRTKGWDAISGTAQKYEYRDGRWRRLGKPIKIAVGRTGLAWGIGLYDFGDQPGPIKKEGDGKAPAGIFRLTTLFSANESAWRYAHMPYISLTPATECVGDGNSASYNLIVDTSNPKLAPKSKDWNSSEHMLRRDDLYDFGVYVAHNANPPKPGAGSCIFIHVLGALGRARGTSGCTALPEDDLVQLFGWLDEKKTPVLIQLPEKEYKSFGKKLGLP